MGEFEDKLLTCIDCGRDFTWTAGEQAYCQEHGYWPPKRCKECRRVKRGRFSQAAQKEGGKK